MGLVSSDLPQLRGRHWLTVGNVGIGMVKPVSGQFSIQAEINLVQRGSSFKLAEEVAYAGCGIISCFTIPLNGLFSSRVVYLTMPVMAGFRFGRTTLAAGPYLGIKLGESQQGHYALGTSADSTPITKSGRTYKDVDLGYEIGLTYAATRLIGVDLRYNQGLLSFVKSARQPTEQSYHQTAQVGVRYNLIR